MIKISTSVKKIIEKDEIALFAARRDILNLSAYAREIKSDVEKLCKKEVQETSITSALSRYIDSLPPSKKVEPCRLQRISVHSNLEGMTYERSEQISSIIRSVYHEVDDDNKTYLTVTQGINEITIVAESEVANVFRGWLQEYPQIYDKKNLVGITTKFNLKYLEIPNLVHALTQRVAYRNVNIVEIISTATELTFVVEKDDLSVVLEQLEAFI